MDSNSSLVRLLGVPKVLVRSLPRPPGADDTEKTFNPGRAIKGLGLRAYINGLGLRAYTGIGFGSLAFKV